MVWIVQLTAKVSVIDEISDVLLPWKGDVEDRLWTELQSSHLPKHRLNAAAILARWDPASEEWKHLATDLAAILTRVELADREQSIECFRPIKRHLIAPLDDILGDEAEQPRHRGVAAAAIADFMTGDSEALVERLVAADQPDTYGPLFRSVTKVRAGTARLVDILNQVRRKGEDASPEELRRGGIAAAALVQLDREQEVWPLLAFGKCIALRAGIVYYLSHLGDVRPHVIDQLSRTDNDGVLQALLTVLGTKGISDLPHSMRVPLIEDLKAIYSGHHDAGVHYAAERALRMCDHEFSALTPPLPVADSSALKSNQTRLAELDNALLDWSTSTERRRIDWEKQMAGRLQSSRVPEEGLVAYYPLDSCPGTEIPNAANPSLPASFEGDRQPEWVPGVVAEALRLNGSGEYVNCGFPITAGRSTPISYGGWFLMEEADWMVPVSQYSGETGNNGVDIFLLSDARVEVHFRNRPRYDSLDVMATSGSGAGNWFHAFVTYDGSASPSGVRIYIDGIQAEQRAMANCLVSEIEVSAPLRLGKRGRRFSFCGPLDDVRVYNRVLSPEDVHSVYQYGIKSLLGVAPELRGRARQEILTRCMRNSEHAHRDALSEIRSGHEALCADRWSDRQRWFVNGIGQSMIIVPCMSPGASDMMTYSFAVATKKVNVGEFRNLRFPSDTPDDAPDDLPVTSCNWYEATEFCNWLSKHEGIPESQWCYVPNERGEYAQGMRIKPDFHRLEGYRLPTVAEWIQVARTGASRSFRPGSNKHLTGRHPDDSVAKYWTEIPNAAGASEMLSGISEFCQDWVGGGPRSTVTNNDRRSVRNSLQPDDRNEHTPETRGYLSFRVAKSLPIPEAE